MTLPPNDREGMILLNVLLVLAVASVAVLVMIAAQDIQVQRGSRLRDAAQAGAYARAGELSAITVLRRDALTTAGTDNLSEPWAAVGQDSITVPGGRFALTIEDEQSRWNINALKSGEPGPIDAFQRIGALAGVAPETLVRIATIVRVAGPLKDFGLLRTAGIPPEDLVRLEPFVIALPDAATLNLNTVDLPLLDVVVGDPAAAGELMAVRTRKGFLTPVDVAAQGLIPPPSSGYTSDHYRVVTTVTVGDTTQRLTSRLARVRQDAAVDVVVVGRKRDAG